MAEPGPSAQVNLGKISVGRIKSKKIRESKIDRAIDRLKHACKCNDSNCPNVDCDELKSTVVHFKLCGKNPRKSCSTCTKLIALCRYHAIHNQKCESAECVVPFCARIKHLILLKKRKEIERKAFWIDSGSDVELVEELESTESEEQNQEVDNLFSIHDILRPKSPENIPSSSNASQGAAKRDFVILNHAPQRFQLITTPSISIQNNPTSRIPIPQHPNSTVIRMNIPFSDRQETPRQVATSIISEQHVQLRPTFSQVQFQNAENMPSTSAASTSAYEPPTHPRRNPPAYETATSTYSPTPDLPQLRDELKVLLHAHKCLSKEMQGAVGGWPCFESNCSIMKNVLKHALTCVNDNCRVLHCVNSRSLLDHWKACLNRECLLCAPIRQSAIARESTLESNFALACVEAKAAIKTTPREIFNIRLRFQRHENGPHGHGQGLYPHVDQ